MENTINKKQFWKMFKGNAIIVTALRQGGRSRDIANQVNHAERRGDASLRTKAEPVGWSKLANFNKLKKLAISNF